MTSFRSPFLLVAGLVGLLGLVLGMLYFLPDAPSTSPAAPDTIQAGGAVWTGPTAVAEGEAHRGPWRMNQSDWRFVDDPSVALATDGTAGVVWTDHRERDLFFTTYGPEGVPQQASPVNVSQTPDTFSWLPRVVFPAGAPDTVYVLWQEIIFSGGTHGGEALFARSTDRGRSFSAPINLSQSEAGDGKGRLTETHWDNGSLDLAVGPGGTLYVAWTEYEGRLWLRRSTDGGASFSAPVHVTGTDATPARGPSLAVDSAGTVHLAWAEGEDPTADVHYAHAKDRWNEFASPRTVQPTDGHADAPSLAVDRTGTLHLAYGVSSPTQPYHVQYTRAPSETDSFAAPVVLSDQSLDTYVQSHYPTLQVQGPDVHVVWELYPPDAPRPRALAYTRSSDGGDTFAPPAVVPGTDDPAHGFNGSQQGLLMEKLAVNEAGGLAVVNSTFDRGEDSHIWLHRCRLDDR